jgi:SAM-dependent methyltransferase
MNDLAPFFKEIEDSLERNDFVKITLSKPISKKNELQNVYIRLIIIKDTPYFQFTYHYKTNDQVKNYTFEELKDILSELLLNSFRFATLFTLEKDVQVFINKKKNVTIKETHPSFKNKLPETHNKPKEKRIEKSEFLYHLGVSDKEGNIIPKMADKFRQINKYLEIIENLIQTTELPKQVKIVDMGSGKGYLTFALYDYLKNKKGFNVKVTGIELREKLVNYCNDIAKKCNYENLHFECKPIEDYNDEQIDILIALHACDTATDDALYKGMSANAQLIVTAPCCHKQIRQHLKGKEPKNPILKFGIFKERQYEMLTDTLRALYLEENNYKTNIFEFVSNEHTRKNVMLVGKKSSKNADPKQVHAKIENLKNEFGVKEHYLEKLLHQKQTKKSN